MQRLPQRNPWADAPILYLRRTTSTMEEALGLHRRGCPEGTVVVAGRQTQGRGRFAHRSWQAGPGEGLLFTLLLGPRISCPPARLPLLSGLAVARTLEEMFGLRSLVKWPNDVLCGQRKLAGILCEAVSPPEGPAFLVGIGLNCNQRRFPAGIRERATSLRQLLGRAVAPLSVLEGLLLRLKGALEEPRWREELSRRLYGLGQEVSVRQGLQTGSGGKGRREPGPPTGSASQAGFRGRLVGLAEDGALLLEPLGSGEGKPVPLYDGEILFSPGGSTE
jgi:biotin-[acetyl-CoA-carboxylase] ligase BirA-like protein